MLLCSTNVVARPLSVEVSEPTFPGMAIQAGELISAPVPLAPIGTIEGPNFDTNAINTGGSYFIPPDPIGAVGPNHVVSIVNVTIQWHTKAGVLENDESLADFFTSLSPQTFTFDPKVIYDQYSDRFLVVTLEQTTGPGTSRILLAVSDDNDPNGTWYFHQIDSKIGNNWADYPGFAVDEEAVYITCNLFSFGAGFFAGQRLWIVGKTSFYAGTPAVVTVHDPWTEVGSPTLAGTTQPAHIFGAAPAGVGTWLVEYSGLADAGALYLGIIRIDNPLTVPTFSVQFVAIGTTATVDSLASMPDAPQLGSTETIETNDRRARFMLFGVTTHCG